MKDDDPRISTATVETLLQADPSAKALRAFVYLLRHAARTPRHTGRVRLERGQVAISVRDTAKRLNMSHREIRTVMAKLEATQVITQVATQEATQAATHRTTQDATVLIICDFDSYIAHQETPATQVTTQSATQVATQAATQAATQEASGHLLETRACARVLDNNNNHHHHYARAREEKEENFRAEKLREYAYQLGKLDQQIDSLRRNFGCSTEDLNNALEEFCIFCENEKRIHKDVGAFANNFRAWLRKSPYNRRASPRRRQAAGAGGAAPETDMSTTANTDNSATTKSTTKSTTNTNTKSQKNGTDNHYPVRTDSSGRTRTEKIRGLIQ